MKKPSPEITMRIEGCWGSLICEDTGQGACRLCVDLCPEVFEKPAQDRCARLRSGVNPIPYLSQIRRIVSECPTGAIRLET